MKFDFNDYKSYLEPLSEEFIKRNKDLVIWYYISEFQKLSEEFIEQNKDLVDWWYISAFQKLSEEFIERNKDLVKWFAISQFQKLSEEFIERNSDLVDWDCISEYQKLSEEFIERNRFRFDAFNEEDKIVIEVKGGVVTNVFSNLGCHFAVIVNDYDCVDCVRVDTQGLEKIW
jgi:hypothetical protein